MTKTALVFAGQGAQVVGMGRDLAEHHPTARDWFNRANDTLGYALVSFCFHGPEEVGRACELAKAKGAKRALPLPVAGAYHSCLMASAQPKLGKALSSVAIQPPKVPVIANVTAQPHGDPPEIHHRLVAQVTSSVRWEESMRYLLGQGFTRFIELGPGKALSGFMKRIDPTAQIHNVADVASLDATTKALTT